MNEWPHAIFLASVYHLIVVLGLYSISVLSEYIRSDLNIWVVANTNTTISTIKNTISEALATENIFL